MFLTNYNVSYVLVFPYVLLVITNYPVCLIVGMAASQPNMKGWRRRMAKVRWRGGGRRL